MACLSRVLYQFRFATCYEISYSAFSIALAIASEDCLRDYPPSATKDLLYSSLHLISQSPIRLRHGTTPGTSCFQDSYWEALPTTCLRKASRHCLLGRKEPPTYKRLLKPLSDTFLLIYPSKPFITSYYYLIS